MADPNIEWGHGPRFAEVAEALHLNTDQIVAALDDRNGWLVLYTPGENYASEPMLATIWAAWLIRDADGLLVVFGEPRQAGTWAEVQDQIEARLREQFGEPR